MKVAVFGASGFVGATLVEHLLTRCNIDMRVYIHGYGNAWRLARLAIPMRPVDILSSSQVSEALEGCSHVVNCTRGSGEVMLVGLKNLLRASKAHGIQRFVHLSSVAVYGDPPPPESDSERAAPHPAPGSYGAEKLRQDDTVAQAARAGLDCVVLCPPNISGVYSSFVSNVLSDIRNGTFGLVEEGKRPLNTIDVDNLAHAIVLALHVTKGDGGRIFVSDGIGRTWRDLADALAPLTELSGPIPNIPANSILASRQISKHSASLWRSAKHIVSSEVREALRQDPLWAKFDTWLRRLAALSGTRFEERLRLSIEGPLNIAKIRDGAKFSSRYNAMQLRNVWHRIDRARDVLGYEPPREFNQSMAEFRAWYTVMHGADQPFWPLVKLLESLQ